MALLPQIDPPPLLVRVAENTAPIYGELWAHGPTSEAIGALTAWEAVWRRTIEWQRALVWHSVGLRTWIERLRELEHREAVAAGSTARKAPGGINWRDGGAGDPLVLINGWTASGIAWPSAWLRSLEARYRVIRPDNRGTGWSRFAPTPFNVADLADDIRGVLAEARVRRAIVVGVSMGGMIAQELAVRHPGVVERLVLVATQPPAPKRIPPTTDIMRTMLMVLRTREVRAHMTRAWSELCAPGFAAANRAVLEELTDQMLRRATPRTSILEQVRAVSGWSGVHRLRRIAAPTTVVHGDADRLIPPENGLRLTEVIPGARLVELSGVGHLVPHEAPDRLTEIIGEGRGS